MGEDIQRYDLLTRQTPMSNNDCYEYIGVCEHGEYVRYEDYEKLRSVIAIACDFCQQLREQGFMEVCLPAEFDTLEEALDKL